MEKPIIIRGARENNLQNISLAIPKGQIIVFTGVSGSGKSSIVFDTIAIESQRQLGETFPLYVRNQMPRYERPKVDVIANLTPAIVINQRPIGGNSRSTVGTMSDIAPLLRLLFSRCSQPSAGASSNYSFNDPNGMCPVCSGLGVKIQLDYNKLLDQTKSLRNGAIRFKPFAAGSWQWLMYTNSGFFDLDKPIAEYSAEEWYNLLHGSGRMVTLAATKPPLPYEGLEDRFNRLYLNRDLSTLNERNQQAVLNVVSEGPCPTCHGARLNKAALASQINGMTIADYCNMEICHLIPILEQITGTSSKPLAQAALAGLYRMEEIGLGYLSLNRSTATLSGGEGQRLKMVKHLGSSLTGMTYILDEPSVGLHPRDIARLNQLLAKLRDKGNTVLVVEHDRDVITSADEIIDMGPGPGRSGGQVMFQGSVADLLRGQTLTAQYLRRPITINQAPRTAKGWYAIENAHLHNLKNITVSFPQGVLCAVTGVAGSGKSTLVKQEFLSRYPQAIMVDQAPIGTGSRSNPATYVGIMDDIRTLFATTNQVESGLFSFNSKGACPVCAGKGQIKPDMAFAEPIAVLCEACGGTRYSTQALQYRYCGKTILDVLNLTVTEALNFFTGKKILTKLQALEAVGLGYITLGQPTASLSGGECQRVKLATELAKSGNIYVMDEPTTGLHMADVATLLTLLNHLVEQGNTVLVVEHNLDVIANADWIIDLGPEGGKNGGQVLFTGTPSQLLSCPHSYTADFLRNK